MYDVFQATDLMEPVVVGCEDESGSLLGVLLGVIIREQNGIKKFFSSRTVVYGGPIVASGLEEQQTYYQKFQIPNPKSQTKRSPTDKF